MKQQEANRIHYLCKKALWLVMNFMSHSTQNKVSPRGRKNDILRLFRLLKVAVHWPACLTSYWCSTVITELNCTIAEPDRQTSEDVRARRLRLLVNCTHSHMGHRRTGSVHLADQDNVAADSRIRPPVCSEYWSVHYLLMSWRPLYMEAICEDNHALGQCTLVIITTTDGWITAYIL